MKETLYSHYSTVICAGDEEIQFEKEGSSFSEKGIKETEFIVSICCHAGFYGAEFETIASAENSCILKAVSCRSCLALIFQYKPP